MSILVVIVVAAMVATPTVAASQVDEFDATFGVDGAVTTPVGTNGTPNGESVALLADGRIVVVGSTASDVVLARYESDGAIDATFGADGAVVTDSGSANTDQASAVAIQSDGRIVVAGTTFNGSDNDLMVLRYEANGTLDLSFGTGGVVTSDIDGGNDFGTSLTVQSDGRIVVAGTSFGGSGHGNDVLLVRYEPDGSLDMSFGSGGIVTTDIAGEHDVANSLTRDGSGRLVVVGTTNRGFTADFALLRYTPQGSLDSTFSSDGIVTTDIGGIDFAESVAVQRDGRIVVAGHRLAATNNDFAVARYESDGSADLSFGADGVVTTDVSSTDFVYSLAVHADGRIVVAGRSGNDLAVVRYGSDGSLDLTFDEDGIVGRTLGDDGSSAAAVAIQPDEKVVVVGSAGASLFVVRVLAPMCHTAPQVGYWLAGQSGDVFNFGDVGDHGGLVAPVSNVADIVTTQTGCGYWLLKENGSIHAFGDATHHGEPDDVTLVGAEVWSSMGVLGDGTGYWTFSTHGQVAAFGAAAHHGDLVDLTLDGLVVDATPTTTGGGYHMLGRDGGVFAFGDAEFHGSIPSICSCPSADAWLDAPAIAIVAEPSAAGYLVIAADGGVFSFGAAVFRGSIPGVLSVPLNAPIVAADRRLDGYVLVAGDGGVFNFSSTPFSGSLGADPPLSPIVAIASIG